MGFDDSDTEPSQQFIEKVTEASALPSASVDMALHRNTPPQAKRPNYGPLEPHTFVDSDWAACLKT